MKSSRGVEASSAIGTIDQTQKRIDSQMNEAAHMMGIVADRFTISVSANVIAAVSAWNTFLPSEVVTKTTEGWGYWPYVATGSLALVTLGLGVYHLIEGVGYLQARRGIMEEVTSLRSVLVGKYNEMLNGQSP